MNLYEISNRYEQLLDKEEYTPEEMAELEAMHDNMEEGCVDRAKYIKNLEAEAEAIEKEMLLMKVRISKLYDKIDLQRDRLMGYMQQGNLKLIKSPTINITIPKPRASVEVFDESVIPTQFWRTTVPVVKLSVDKDTVKKELEAGVEIPGVRLSYKSKIVFK